MIVDDRRTDKGSNAVARIMFYPRHCQIASESMINGAIMMWLHMAFAKVPGCVVPGMSWRFESSPMRQGKDSC